MDEFFWMDAVIKLSMSDVWKCFDRINEVTVQCKLCNVKLECHRTTTTQGENKTTFRQKFKPTNSAQLIIRQH